MKKRIFAVTLVLLMAIVSFTGCGGNQESSDTIKIGSLGPISGELSVYGVPATNGIQLAVEEINANGGINGKQIELILYDEKGDAMEAVNAYNKLVQSDGVCAIVGDITSGNSIAVAQQAINDGIPLITPTGTADAITPIGDNIFRACFMDSYQGDVMATFAKERLGAKTAAILYNTSDDYSKGLTEAFVKTAGEIGITVVAKEGYKKGDVDFKAQLTSINGKNPDVFFIPVYAEDAALIAVQAKTVGIKAQILGGDGWDGTISKVEKSNYEAIENILYCNHYSPQAEDEKLQKFIEDYKAKYTDAPSSFAALGYDATFMLKTAIENAGSLDKTAICEALKAIEFTGTTGHMTFDENRNPIKSAVILEIKDGAEHYVETFEK